MQLNTPYKILDSFTHLSVADRFNHRLITSIADEETTKEIIKRVNAYDDLVNIIKSFTGLNNTAIDQAKHKLIELGEYEPNTEY